MVLRSSSWRGSTGLIWSERSSHVSGWVICGLLTLLHMGLSWMPRSGISTHEWTISSALVAPLVLGPTQKLMGDFFMSTGHPTFGFTRCYSQNTNNNLTIDSQCGNNTLINPTVSLDGFCKVKRLGIDWIPNEFHQSVVSYGQTCDYDPAFRQCNHSLCNAK